MNCRFYPFLQAHIAHFKGYALMPLFIIWSNTNTELLDLVAHNSVKDQTIRPGQKAVFSQLVSCACSMLISAQCSLALKVVYVSHQSYKCFVCWAMAVTVDSKEETKANKILLERSLAPAGVCFLLLSFTLTKTPVLALRFAGELPLATFVGEM